MVSHSRRYLAVFVSLLLVFSLLPISAFAVEDPPEPFEATGVTESQFSGGTGTDGDPYLISSATDLATFAELVNSFRTVFDYYDKCYKLTKDINVYEDGYSGVWVPIGQTIGFRGTFDGNGHTISRVIVSTGDQAGFFKNVIIEGKVTNLALTEVDITGENATGGIAGSVENGGLIKQCSVSGRVSGSNNVGGIVGTANNGALVEDTYTFGSVQGNTNVGGIAGSIGWLSTVKSSYSASFVSGGSTVGGIVGQCGDPGIGFETSCSVKDCFALNERITSQDSRAGRVYGFAFYDADHLGNRAFAGMIVNGSTVEGSGWNGHGLDVTAAQLQTPGAFPLPFYAPFWTHAEGKLPGLFGAAIEMPSHLRYITGAPTLTGTVSLSGEVKYCGTVTADTSGLTSNPTANLGALSYEWRTDGVPVNSFNGSGASYSPMFADIGKELSVVVTASNCNGMISSNSLVVAKEVQDAIPAKPVMESRTADSITIAVVLGFEEACEYRLGTTGTWQDSRTITGLSASTTYTIYVRYKENATRQPSVAVASDPITTSHPPQTAPTPPEVDMITATSITLKSVAGLEYSRDGQAWSTNVEFTGLSPFTTYGFYARKAETSTQGASPASAAAEFTTSKASLGGSVSIVGIKRYGSTLWANTFSITASPAADLSTLSYVWKREGTPIPNATDKTYLLQESDIGKIISLEVSSANCLGSVSCSLDYPIQKMISSTPASPVLASRTTSSITLVRIAGAEYSRDGLTWQDSNTFTGLSANTQYLFFARIKETATQEASPPSLAASYKTDVVFVDEQVPVVWTRHGGAHRYATMSKLVSAGFSKSDRVIIATGENFPDALAAASIAGLYNAPIILTHNGSLHADARAQIKRLGANKAYLIGGTASLSSKVESEVKKMGLSVSRIAGTAREQTAIKIFEQGKKQWGKTAIIASGQGFADALSISSFSYANKAPIFLTDSKKQLSADTIAAVKAGGFTHIVIVGGTAAVSNSVTKQLGSSFNYKRLGGTDRYETSRLIAQWAVDRGMTANSMAVATGTNFPDALAGGALSGTKGSVLLLVEDSPSAHKQAKAFFAKNKSRIKSVHVLGGEGTISNNLLGSLRKYCS